MLMTASFFLCDRLVYADDTNRVIHVTKRFFSFFMILVTVHIASRTKQKGLLLAAGEIDQSVLAAGEIDQSAPSYISQSQPI